jgi:hypothetical protein
MSTQNRFTSSIKALIFSAIFIIAASISGSAQATPNAIPKSRIAVVATETKTNIWVSDFPKGTTIVLFDEESNIISIQSTNVFGAAYISLPKSITSTIFAKTLNGEVSVSNKAVLKGIKPDQNIAANTEVAVEATKA